MSVIDVQEVLEEIERQRTQRPGLSATSVNIVAFVDDRKLLEPLTQRLEELAERNVSRALLLACEDCDHVVTSHGSESGDTYVTRSEQIRLSVKDLDSDRLHSVVHDLLVPNVRTVLLWGGEHVRDPRFSALAQLAEVVVVFSSALDTGTGALREIVELRPDEWGAKVNDLAFLRLLPWQDLIAQFFDDAELAGQLPHLRKVDVVSGSAAEAYYLVGWLASRLAWEPCGKNEFCNQDGGTVTIAASRRGMPRRLYSVRLEAAQCTFGVQTEDDSDVACLTVEGTLKRQQRCLPLHDFDMVSLVERAMFSPPSALYLETLQKVRRLLEHEQ